MPSVPSQNVNNKINQLTTRDAGERFLLHVCRFSPHTHIAYNRVIKRFVIFAPEYIENITAETIERFILETKVKYSNSTRNNYLAIIQSFFAWLGLNYDIRNVAKRVERLKALPPKQRILSQDEYDKVMAATTGYMRDCIQFLAMTGLRESEFLSLQPSNISNGFLTIVGKGSKQRTIPLNPTALSVLKKNPTMQFLKSRGQKWLLRLCHRAAKIAEIPKFSPHSLRHYFATELHIRHKMPIEIVSKLLGHSSPTTTATIYIHWQNADLAGVTDCLK
ncbi:MAG: tyrosine-type recombinase/integrase [Phycisphaerae bacterium]|nr:tyrosine-type recombinase/integrase [Phycisphaerae bacterium]